MAIEAILFDVDGTLADTERDGHRPAFNKAFEAHGLEWVWDENLYGELLAVTGGKERIRHYVEKYLPAFSRSAGFGDLVAALHKDKTRYYTEMLAEGLIPMRPGVTRLLNEARAAGVRLAVATTTTPENVAALLRYSLAEDALDWFEVIAAGDIVPAKKPAPDIYFWALQKLQLGPERCVAIEDSGNGLRASLGAGLRTVVTVNGYTARDDFGGAAAVLSDLGEPDTAFTMLAGDACGHRYVDLALLGRWFG